MTGVAMQFLFWFLAGVVALVLFLVAWRFSRLHARGTRVALRRLPASGTHGWRIGIFRYTAGNIYYYKIRSLFPMADAIFVRSKVDISGKRAVDDSEASFLNDDEYMEVTPESIRLRKQILDKAGRDKANKKKKTAD